VSRYETEVAQGFAYGAKTIASLNEIVRAMFQWNNEPSDATVVIDADGSARIYVREAAARTRAWDSVEALVRFQIRHLESGVGMFGTDERASLIARFRAWCTENEVAA
jgi:hypothetical protein